MTESPKRFNNEQLAKEISRRYPEYLTYEVQDMLQIVPLVIEDLVAEGHTIKLMNFGTFAPKKNNDRFTKHPQTGVWELFKGNLTMKFTIARSLMDRLRLRGKKNEAA